MSYECILVLLDHDKHCAARVKHAIDLALQFECHLVGLVPTGLVDLPSTSYAAASIVDLATLAWDALRSQSERLAQAFRVRCEASGLRGFEAVIEESDKAESLVRHANLCDLTVLTQTDPTESTHAAWQHVVEAALLQSAKPTLVFPFAAGSESIGRHVMVAWDGSRASARAIGDALPILARASKVELVSWINGSADDAERIGQHLRHVARALKRHGVGATVNVERTRGNVGDAMRSRAADGNVDLIVMGAYGHARWAQRVLGGATRSMLNAMTVPVLMTH